RRLGRWAGIVVGGACLAALVLVLVGYSAQARSVPPVEAPSQQVKPPSAPTAFPEICTDGCQGTGREAFGTAVEFVRNVPEASRAADKQHKLMFVLHVSGNFEDTGFT